MEGVQLKSNYRIWFFAKIIRSFNYEILTISVSLSSQIYFCQNNYITINNIQKVSILFEYR